MKIKDFLRNNSVVVIQFNNGCTYRAIIDSINWSTKVFKVWIENSPDFELEENEVQLSQIIGLISIWKKAVNHIYKVINCFFCIFWLQNSLHFFMRNLPIFLSFSYFPIFLENRFWLVVIKFKALFTYHILTQQYSMVFQFKLLQQIL